MFLIDLDKNYSTDSFDKAITLIYMSLLIQINILQEFCQNYKLIQDLVAEYCPSTIQLSSFQFRSLRDKNESLL